MRRIASLLVLILIFNSFIACAADNDNSPPKPPVDDISFAFAENNDGLNLPDGFKAVVVTEGVGSARHMVVRDNGDIYVRLRRSNADGFSIVALRDTTSDGVADVSQAFATEAGGTGIDIYNGYLYYSSDTELFRRKLVEGQLIPSDNVERIVTGFEFKNQHDAKSFTFDEEGHVYINVGAPANACQEDMRTPGSPGMDPCPILEKFAGVWKFDANTLNQVHMQDGERYVTGIRNCVAIDWSKNAGDLYTVQHGRDQLNTLFSEYYDAQDNAELPAEEVQRQRKGANHGWPYTYYDPIKDKRVLAPEYGGDGEMVSDREFDDPVYAFPAHWAPNDLLFYEGNQYPNEYKNGAFVAFHGSWNRAPEPQRGYNVCFLAFENGELVGPHSVFADGFAGKDVIVNPNDANYRPMGLAQGSDGSLYICDSKQGRVWRIIYTK